MMPADFIELVKQLRELGATEVHAGSFSARFAAPAVPAGKPSVGPSVAEPAVDAVEVSPADRDAYRREVLRRLSR